MPTLYTKLFKCKEIHWEVKIGFNNNFIERIGVNIASKEA
jgi:hypothetical protein